jgi:dTDP-4-amino-4,6-dideoxygalactose transaminase
MSRMYLSPPDVGPAERNALLQAFDSGWIAPAGPDLNGFELDLAAITGWPGSVAMSSGTAALHLALDHVGVGPDDDVFVSTFTFAASANAVRYCGANPVFIDSDTDSWNMSPALLSEAFEHARSVGKLPRAVVVVDLYGQCADYDLLRPICDAHGVPIIEDAAEAMLATYKRRPAGTLGDFGVFSFNGNKIITTSGGGAFVSPDTDSSDRIRYLAQQARCPAVHYEHTEVGFNYRLSNLLAAVGRAQLERLPAMSARRLAINSLYRSLLSDLQGVDFMPVPEWSQWNGWLTCMTFSSTAARDAVIERLDEADIESRPLWKPMHLQPVFAECSSFVDGTSDDLFRRGLCVPSGSVLTDDQVERVAALIRAVVLASSLAP